ncbi:unnamed protein product [Phytophthora lilii]|uniref:RxLR effector protein n=1 Tax=Phytophthora lilii TaxID=2077276 RepID=A0A9W6WU36_9STRA|nr:unnamed protein product [Phytophthora lilii]
MRVSYILAVVVVAILHAGGDALSTAKNGEHTLISDNVSPDDVRSLDGTVERQLRTSQRKADDEVDEERMFSFLKKNLPGLSTLKKWRADKKKKNQDLIIYLLRKRQGAQ